MERNVASVIWVTTYAIPQIVPESPVYDLSALRHYFSTEK
jgi:hypothetical protein